MGKGPCAEHTVDITEVCYSDYQKKQKKMDSRLYASVESVFESLKTNPILGHKLRGPLEGKRSAVVDEFAYRIIYEINSRECKIIIHAVGHHNRVYQELIRYLKTCGLI